MYKIYSVFLFFIASISYSQIGIGTNQPNSSAILELKSTTKGFLFPRLTQVQRNNITAPLIGLTIYCTNCEQKGVQSYNGTEWIPLSGIIHDGLKYETVVTPTGRVWLDRNLGATRAAVSQFDTDSYGYLYNWGRRSDGHQLRTSPKAKLPIATSATPGNSTFIYGNNNGDPAHAAGIDDNWTDYVGEQNLWQGVNGVNNPCPSGFRLPTFKEFEAELIHFSGQDAQGAYESVLKLPSTGTRREDTGGFLTPGNDSVKFNSLYHTSTLTDLEKKVRHLLFFQRPVVIADPSKAAEGTYWLKIVGAAVRCIKD